MDLTDPQQWNAYSYAYNSPITLSDPTGMRSDYFDPCCGGNAGASTGGGTPGGTTSGSGGSNSGSGGGSNSGGGSSGGGSSWSQFRSGIWNAGRNFVSSGIAPFKQIYNDYKNKGVGAALWSTGELGFATVKAGICPQCSMYDQIVSDVGVASDFIDAARSGDVEGMTEAVAGKGIEVGIGLLPLARFKLPVRAPATPRPATPAKVTPSATQDAGGGTATVRWD